MFRGVIAEFILNLHSKTKHLHKMVNKFTDAYILRYRYWSRTHYELLASAVDTFYITATRIDVNLIISVLEF